MGGPRLLHRFFAKQKQLELFNTHFVVRTLKLAFMPNFSQIGKVTWPRFFFKVRKLQTIALYKLLSWGRYITLYRTISFSRKK